MRERRKKEKKMENGKWKETSKLKQCKPCLGCKPLTTLATTLNTARLHPTTQKVTNPKVTNLSGELLPKGDLIQ